MAKESVVTREAIVREVEALRRSGLASFNVATVPLITQLAIEAEFAPAVGEVAVYDIRRFLESALGLIDQDALESSAACLMAVRAGMDLGASLKDRTADAAKRVGVTPHAYNGRPPKGHKTRDLHNIADNLVAVHRSAVRRQNQAKRRRADMPAAPELVAIEPPESVQAAMADAPASEWLARRYRESTSLWRDLLKERDEQLERVGPLSGKVCIFASGSYGRDEAMEYSDVDLFLVDDVPRGESASNGRLNKFELGAALTLIDRTREARGIQKFSQAGFYQEPQSFRQMLAAAGDRGEGPLRPTTARALLLANSKCFAHGTLYTELRQRALDEYWRDQTSYRRPLMPIFLINDLRRLWLTMLIDYEHFYPKHSIEGGHRMAGVNRRIAGLKLVVAQKLGCYTPVLAMLERSTGQGLMRQDAEEVLRMTTSQRLEHLTESNDSTIASAATALRELYGQYLAYSWCDKEEMEERVMAPDAARVRSHLNEASTLILSMLWTYHARIPEVARFALV